MFEALKNGKEISLIVDPSFFYLYQEKAGEYIARLRALGVKQVYDGGFGAELSVWGHVEYLRKQKKTKHKKKAFIANCCPAFSSYARRYHPELLDYIIPVQDPMVCMAIYAKKYLKDTGDIAVLSADDYYEESPLWGGEHLSLLHATFSQLEQVLRAVPTDIKGLSQVCDVRSFGMGDLVPVMGGFAECTQHFFEREEVVLNYVGLSKSVLAEVSRMTQEKKVQPLLVCLHATNGGFLGEAGGFQVQPAFMIEHYKKSRKDVQKLFSDWGDPEKDYQKLRHFFRNIKKNDFLVDFAIWKNENYEAGALLPEDEVHEAERQKLDAKTIDWDVHELLATIEQLKKELFLAQEEAKEANRLKSDFVSNMSHEIRTPLNAILGFNELILRETKEKKIESYALDMQSAGKALSGIVNDILDFAKIESGRMSLVQEEYELAPLIRAARNMILPMAQKKSLLFQIEFDENIPFLLLGDGFRVQQVILNLLTNAVKYTNYGTVSLKIQSEKIDDEHVRIKVVVSDTGIGMKKEEMKKLFDPFSRMDMKRNKTIAGTGLGMSLVNHLLTEMGSTLLVDSAYGRGTVFSFEFDQEVISWEPAGSIEKQGAKQIQTVRFMAPEAKVLVVDDSELNLIVVEGLLERTGMQVRTAGSGFRCLELASEEHFDIILLDHRMPKMDGVETFERLRSEPGPNQNTPVVILTANAVEGARGYYEAIGFDAFLTKPVAGDKLESCIRRMIPKGLQQFVKLSEEEISKLEMENQELTPEESLAKNEAGTGQPVHGESSGGDSMIAMSADSRLTSWYEKESELIAGNEIMDGALENTEPEELVCRKKGVEACQSEMVYERIKGEFLLSGRGLLEELCLLFEQEDWENYIIKVHALKSTARFLGAQALSDLAKEIEGAGNEGRLEEVRQNSGQLFSDFEQVYQYFELLQKQSEQPGEEEDRYPVSEKELGEILSSVIMALDEFDFDQIDEVVKQLEQYQLPENFSERFAQLKLAVYNLDDSKIREIISEYQSLG